MVGHVKDAQGGIVPGGTVTLVNTGTNLKRETTTDAQGAFNFVNVLAGQYDVRVTLTGFRETVRSGVPVSNGEISRVDIALEIGAMSETVTVKSEAELLQTDKADVKTDLKADEIVNLPLNQFRNYQALVVLVPGALPPVFQNAETDTPQRSLSMTVNGQSGNGNPTRTDGAMNVFVTMPHHTAYVAPAETIDTVSITTGSMDAETGMAAGAAITVTTKSGTNTFKGSAFEDFANQKLAATPYYFGRGAQPTKLPVERQTAGGTLGGPILRNKLFFFSSYEGYFSDLNQYAFYSVPTAAMRNGDLSGALNANGTQQAIFDPMTGDLATGTGRQQFPNNVIPASRINSISRTLVAQYPLPNVEGTGAGGLTNNYRVEQRAQTDRHNVDFKVNWNRTSAHQIWGKFSQMKALVDDLFTFPIGASDDDGGQTTVRQYTFGHTWSLSPTLLLDSSFGASTQDQFVSSPDFHLGNIGLDLGIPGTNDQGRGDPRYAGMPQFSTGFTALGNTPAWSPIYREEYSDSFNTNLTKVAGRHDLKAGYFLNHLTLDDWQPSTANPRGNFTFATNATRTFGTGAQTGNFYNQYAAFLLGLVGSAAKGYQYQRFTANEFQHALFFRDRWTPTSKLTLDLGLRWEYYPIMRRKDYQIEMLDLNTLDMLIGGLGGNPKNMGLDAPKDSFAPRAGIVYRLDEKTVVRTGYGLTYDAQGMSGELAFYGYQSYPLMLNASFVTPPAQSTFGWYGTLDQGIPMLADPDFSSGRLPLPNTLNIQTAVPESVNRGKTHSWNVAFERRLPLVSVDVAYVGNRVRGALSKVNVNPVLHMGGRPGGSSVLHLARQAAAHQHLQALRRDGLRRFTGRRHAAAHARVSAQRALHLRQHMVTWHRLQQRCGPQLRAPNRGGAGAQLESQQRQPAAYRHDVLCVSASMAERRDALQRRAGARQRLAGQRHLPGVQRRAVHRHRRRHGAQHPRQHADSRPRRHRHENRGDRRQWVLLRSGRVGAAGGRTVRHLAAEPVPGSRRLEPRLLRVPGLPNHRQAPGRAPFGRVQHHQHDEVRQPDEQHHEPGFHAHLRPELRVRSAAVEVRAPVQLLRQAGSVSGLGSRVSGLGSLVGFGRPLA